MVYVQRRDVERRVGAAARIPPLDQRRATPGQTESGPRERRANNAPSSSPRLRHRTTVSPLPQRARARHSRPAHPATDAGPPRAPEPSSLTSRISASHDRAQPAPICTCTPSTRCSTARRRSQGLVERAAAFGQPALGLTDHGVMNGAVELYQAARKAGIKPIIGCEVYFVDDHAAVAAPGQRLEHNHLTLLAAQRRRLPQPRAALLGGLPRGPPTRQADRRHGADRALRRRRDRADRLPGIAAVLADRRRAPRRGPRARRPADRRARTRQRLLRGADATASRCRTAATRRSCGLAREMGGSLVGTGDVHYLRREDYDHHAALLCVQTKSTLAEPKIRFETNEFYLKDSAEMAAGVRAVAGGDRVDARDRRALQRRARARPPADPGLPGPRRRDRPQLPAAAGRAGPARALRRPAAGGDARARWRPSSR